MDVKQDCETLRKKLKEHSQGHLLTFLGHLSTQQKKGLLEQIRQLDLNTIDCWIEKYVKNSEPAAAVRDFIPAPSYAPQPVDAAQGLKYDRARKLGRELISQRKVAAFVVAGGQGTRLGFDGPKGDFPISPVKNKTMFRLFAEYIAAAGQKYNTSLPWYIMTSPLNFGRTSQIFRSNDYYGLGKDNVFIFQQGTLPNFSLDGKILLADKDRISCSPDGHGGSLKALHKSGALEDMSNRGVEFISYFQVDNPLADIFDPLFIGLHVLDNAEMSSKAVIKVAPDEKVGVFCAADGRIIVVEYSDLPQDLAERKNPDGSLLFNLGSIAIHIFNRSFVENINAGEFSLPLHRAVKKIPHIDEQGHFIEPEKPNGIKLESFVFDALPLASKSIILQTLRSQQFAPVKNAAGNDSPDSARVMMIERAADWLESAGIEVPRKADNTVDAVIEIAPAFALEKDDVKAKLEKVPKINRGDRVYLA